MTDFESFELILRRSMAKQLNREPKDFSAINVLAELIDQIERLYRERRDAEKEAT